MYIKIFLKLHNIFINLAKESHTTEDYVNIVLMDYNLQRILSIYLGNMLYDVELLKYISNDTYKTYSNIHPLKNISENEFYETVLSTLQKRSINPNFKNSFNEKNEDINACEEFKIIEAVKKKEKPSIYNMPLHYDISSKMHDALIGLIDFNCSFDDCINIAFLDYNLQLVINSQLGVSKFNDKLLEQVIRKIYAVKSDTEQVNYLTYNDFYKSVLLKLKGLCINNTVIYDYDKKIKELEK